MGGNTFTCYLYSLMNIRCCIRRVVLLQVQQLKEGIASKLLATFVSFYVGIVFKLYFNSTHMMQQLHKHIGHHHSWMDRHRD
jgi:hypothetical protein